MMCNNQACGTVLLCRLRTVLHILILDCPNSELIVRRVSMLGPNILAVRTVPVMRMPGRRLARAGFAVLPPFPARVSKDAATLENWIAMYQGEAGVKQALLLAGGVASPVGDFHSSMQLMETGLFDKAGFTRLHVAGHPEGNRDIDPHGGTALVDEAMRWKQAFSETTDAEMAIATQFAFDAKPIIKWADDLAAAGITLPIHIGIAGPAKLQTLIKFAIACGVGPSLKVLQKRAMDVTKLLLPYEPTEVVSQLAAHKAAKGRGAAA